MNQAYLYEKINMFLNVMVLSLQYKIYNLKCLMQCKFHCCCFLSVFIHKHQEAEKTSLKSDMIFTQKYYGPSKITLLVSIFLASAVPFFCLNSVFSMLCR